MCAHLPRHLSPVCCISVERNPNAGEVESYPRLVMPPARDTRMGRAHIQASIEPDKRRLHEHGVNKTNTGSAKKGPPAKHSFRARVECFRPSPPPPPHRPPKPREPTPLPENPTEAFFKTLKRELDARHAAAIKDDDGDVTTTKAPRNSSSPPLAPPDVENVTKLECKKPTDYVCLLHTICVHHLPTLAI